MISFCRRGKCAGVSAMVVAAVVLLFASVALADGLTVEKKVDGLTVITEIHNDPPVTGKNHITVELLDAKKKAITGATVELYYFMPMMPEMAYKAIAEPKESKYVATINLVMGGGWQVDVNVKKTGEEVKKVSVTFDAK